VVDKHEYYTKGQVWELEVGRLIRTMRHDRSLLLADLAARTGLSVSFLSQLERGLTRPTLHSLGLIAEALGTSAKTLLGLSDREVNGQVSVVRSGEGLQIAKRTGTAVVLARGAQRISPMLVVDGPTQYRDEFREHDGDVFFHVLTGTVEVDIGENGLYELHRGDSISIREGIAHRWRRLGQTPCTLLLVEHTPLDTVVESLSSDTATVAAH
jgi:transcriptional regulator with XRE-family HTH domain